VRWRPRWALRAPWISNEERPGLSQWVASFGENIHLSVVYRYELWTFYVDIGSTSTPGRSSRSSFTTYQAAQHAAEKLALQLVAELLDLVPDALKTQTTLSESPPAPSVWNRLRQPDL
jgi:hypothetical protein